MRADTAIHLATRANYSYGRTQPVLPTSNGGIITASVFKE
jgi:hypothetical protein